MDEDGSLGLDAAEAMSVTDAVVPQYSEDAAPGTPANQAHYLQPVVGKVTVTKLHNYLLFVVNSYVFVTF